jgi:hypothetical protein
MDTIAGWENMTKGEIVTLAVDRLYAQLESEYKMDDKINAIRYGFHAADLFEGWQDEDPEKYHERLSASKYADLVNDALRNSYPGVEITVTWDYGASGALPEPLKPAVDTIGVWETDHDEIGAIEHIAGQVYQDFAWCVEKGE